MYTISANDYFFLPLVVLDDLETTAQPSSSFFFVSTFGTGLTSDTGADAGFAAVAGAAGTVATAGIATAGGAEGTPNARAQVFGPLEAAVPAEEVLVLAMVFQAIGFFPSTGAGAAGVAGSAAVLIVVSALALAVTGPVGTLSVGVAVDSEAAVVAVAAAVVAGGGGGTVLAVLACTDTVSATATVTFEGGFLSLSPDTVEVV